MPNFLDLTPELRNRIYYLTESLLPSQMHTCSKDTCGDREHVEEGFIVWLPQCTFHPKFYHHYVPPHQPTITRTCRQIREETLPVYYGANSFTIGIGMTYQFNKTKTEELITRRIHQWLEAIRKHISLMTDVVIEYPEFTGSPNLGASAVSDFAFGEGVVKHKIKIRVLIFAA